MKRIVIVIAGLLAFGATSAHAAFPGRNGALIYGRFEGFYSEAPWPSTFTNGIDALLLGHVRPRVVNGCRDRVVYPDESACAAMVYSDPAVDPSGKHIAFDAGRSLALVDIDGRGLHHLPAHGADDGQPAFSPTGKQLAFSTGGDAAAARGEREVWISDTSGLHARRLARGANPAWSTSGWIAFERSGQIFRIRPDGRELRRMTRRGGSSPTWSPRGSELAFCRIDGVFVMDADGTRVRRVSREGEQVAWSPDGRRLLLSGSALGTWTIDTHGGNRRSLDIDYIDGAGYDLRVSGIDWQPLP
jgi:WD40 repeat protein